MIDATTHRSAADDDAGQRKLVAFLHATIDGFIATSRGVFWERFAWGEAEMRWNTEQFRQADTWVMGRTMYETIVPWWTAVAAGRAPEDAAQLSPADHDFAQVLSRMTKVAVSRTLEPREDRPVITDDVPAQLEKLKRRPGANLMLSCGPALLSELAQQEALIDEYIVIFHPAAIGAGVPLFGPLAHEVKLDLAEIKAFDAGAAAVRYRPIAR